MTKYSGPEDIYVELVEKSTDDKQPLLGLVAFAVFEELKIEWIKHQRENTGQTPSTLDIENWYSQRPAAELDRVKETAETKLRAYGETAIDTYSEQFQQQTEEGIIVGEIRSIKKSQQTEEGIIVGEIRLTKKFLPQFGVNVAGGFVSTLIFAVLLAFIAFFVLNDSSPVDIGAKLRHKIEVNK